MEARLYGLLVERLPATTIVSVGHRAGLARFHQHHIVIAGGAEGGRLTRLPAAAQVSA
jgi:putative ATP-binding cassette transporter